MGYAYTQLMGVMTQRLSCRLHSTLGFKAASFYVETGGNPVGSWTVLLRVGLLSSPCLATQPALCLQEAGDSLP